MKTKTKYLITFLLLFQGIIFSQSSGEIKGVVIDKETGETLIGASVWVNYGGNMIGDASNLDGKYTLKPLTPGTYSLTASFSGKRKYQINEIKVNPDKITFLDTIFLSDTSIMGEEFEVFAYRDKLIDPEEPSRMTLDETQIKTIAGARNPNTLLTQASGGAITTSADGQEVYFRGSRNSSFITYYDGMKIAGTPPSIPMAALKSYSVYTGGLPAKYGDTSGGVIVIETKSFFDLYNQRVAQLGIEYKKKETEVLDH